MTQGLEEINRKISQHNLNYLHLMKKKPND